MILICWFNTAFEEIAKSSSPDVLNGLNGMRGNVDLVLSRLMESYSPGEMAGRSYLLRKGRIQNDRHVHKCDNKTWGFVQ